MKNMMLFLMALLMSGHMMAQQTIVTGVITDANDGSPLIGANVLVKGAGTGSIANVDGKYSVNVPNGKNVLVFSCVGYKEQEITLKPGQKVLNVTMKEDTELLDEVVVTPSYLVKLLKDNEFCLPNLTNERAAAAELRRRARRPRARIAVPGNRVGVRRDVLGAVLGRDPHRPAVRRVRPHLRRHRDQRIPPLARREETPSARDETAGSGNLPVRRRPRAGSIAFPPLRRRSPCQAPSRCFT